jgi:hypothetical protein
VGDAVLKITIDWRSCEATPQTKPKPSRGTALSKRVLYLMTKADPYFQYVCIFYSKLKLKRKLIARSESRLNSTYGMSLTCMHSFMYCYN